MVGFPCCRKREDYYVALPKDVIPGHVNGPDFSLNIRLLRARPVEDLGSHRLHSSRDGLSYRTHAEDSDLFAVDGLYLLETAPDGFVGVPLSGADEPVGVGYLPQEGYRKPDGELSDGLTQPARDLRNVDSPLRCFLHVNVVVAGGVAADDLQPLGFLYNLAWNRVQWGDDESVVFPDYLLQLFSARIEDDVNVGVFFELLQRFALHLKRDQNPRPHDTTLRRLSKRDLRFSSHRTGAGKA